MSMLEKFRKTGGFQQLVQIIEICEPAKQKNMLILVGQEDPGWAHLVKAKSLSLERVMSWPHQVLMSILLPLSVPVQAALYNSINDVQRGNMLKAIHPRMLREIQDHATQKSPSPEECFSARVQLIQTTRELINVGRLDPAAFDPALLIEQKLAA
jgi:flagellar motor switch protein FliG